jgi:hypothetical protein
MSNYRNIDSFLLTPTSGTATVANSRSKLPPRGIPKKSEEVTIITIQNEDLQLKVEQILDDRKLIRGVVVKGYCQCEEDNPIREGDKVEFSKEKTFVIPR